jgi:hypothetical protein
MSSTNSLKELHRKNRIKIVSLPSPCAKDDLKVAYKAARGAPTSPDDDFIIESLRSARAEDKKRFKLHVRSPAKFTKALFRVAWKNKFVGTLASARCFHEVRWRVAGIAPIPPARRSTLLYRNNCQCKLALQGERH